MDRGHEIMFVHGKIIMFGPKNSVCLCVKKKGEWGGVTYYLCVLIVFISLSVHSTTKIDRLLTVMVSISLEAS